MNRRAALVAAFAARHFADPCSGARLASRNASCLSVPARLFRPARDGAAARFATMPSWSSAAIRVEQRLALLHQRGKPPVGFR